MNEKIIPEKEAGRYESAFGIAGFSLVHGLLLALIDHGKLTKDQAIEIIESSRTSIPLLPVSAELLGTADHFLEKMKIVLSSS